ncbi:RAM signaling pathway protein-domain-containing protein [Dichotomopilus funicola]|uniref:RAM signaling pathway protein-domain-containing protein n=1 Tax=Dichotomopilus funicola TaxID=1934379 RepID=A0AAN6UXS4_9PEZI|nr:RAM signaling pathway protein-domain-containing protein [Dichotomopilus funicola]
MDYPRGLPDNPAQARRAVAAAALANPTPPPPVPSLRDVPSSSTLSAGQPLSPSQVLAIAKEAMRVAHENEAKAAEASGVVGSTPLTLKPGLTVDLSRKKIQNLPEEVVDVIKDELERLALSHNYLETFPTRFSECTSLRYLNVRQNKIREFPLALCDLKSLEILDLGRNKLQVLPPEIVKLSSLKVFSIPQNKITHLPLCMADMPSLSVVKLEGNPLQYPPPEILQVQGSGGAGDRSGKENEEVAATAVIKKFLKQEASGRSDSPGESGTEGTETPRPTIKRVFSGRFPIKVNGSEIADLRSPAPPRAPPIPTRSHYRGLSQQNTTQRRPGAMPLTIGNPNERVRSNSETIIQTSSRERSESRSRRMGIVSKRSELSTLEEIDGSNRFSHYRGLSHGSAMQGNGPSALQAQVNSPNNGGSPAEPALQRPVYIRRLSVLPERRRESKLFDPVLEAAKGILYSVFQIHPMIKTLVNLTNDGTTRRSNLEIVVYNTEAHVVQLEIEIQRHEQQLGDDGSSGPKENEHVQRACLTLISAYTHVCSLLMSNVDLFLDNGDPRYLRTLLTQLYNSIMELRVTCTQAAPEAIRQHRAVPSFSRPDLVGETIKPRSRENSVTPTADRIVNRSRNGTFVYNPSNLRVATDVSMPYMINASGRPTMTGAATPRSGESFASATSGTRNLSADFTEEDRMFERIFLSLHKTTELVMQVLPTMNTQFMSSMRATATTITNHNTAQQQQNQPLRSPDDHRMQCWKALVAKCNTSIQQTEGLKARLSSIKLKEPGIRTQTSFWRLCNSFIDSWYVLIKKIMQLQSDVQLPADTKARLRPIQKSMKDTCDLMMSSPWAYLLRQGGGTFSSSSSSSELVGAGGGLITSPYMMNAAHLATPVQQLPMTPQSAALGPAVQATVPSTPQSASFSLAFSGVFERDRDRDRDRSDTMASSLGGRGGIGGGYNSNLPSRSGTMNSSSTASLTASSANSISSLGSQDGAVTPSSALSPGAGPLGPLPFRLNGGSGNMKVVGGF